MADEIKSIGVANSASWSVSQAGEGWRWWWCVYVGHIVGIGVGFEMEFPLACVVSVI